MVKYNIYTWGDGSHIPPFDPASTLLSSLIVENNLQDSVSIIPNSNIFQSHSGSLPFMKSENGSIQHEGFLDIWKTINPDGVVPGNRILYTAYLNDLITSLEIITLYNFFVVKKNYEGFTRSTFPQLLPWPTQYKPPVDIRSRALELCFNLGIIDHEDIEKIGIKGDDDHNTEDELTLLRKEEAKLKDTPVLNDLQKSQMDKELDIISQKKSIIANMHCIRKLKDILQKYEELKNSFNDQTQSFFQIVLYTYLKCNTCDQLPEKFIHIWLQKEQPQLYQTIINFNPPLMELNTCEKIPLATALRDSISSIF